MDDFEAFKFEKKPLEPSRVCFGTSLGEDGKGGREVKSGEFGCASFVGRGAIGTSTPPSLIGLAPTGEGESLSKSVGEPIVLLTADVFFGIARESEAGLAMSLALPKICNHSWRLSTAKKGGKEQEHEPARQVEYSKILRN